VQEQSLEEGRYIGMSKHWNTQTHCTLIWPSLATVAHAQYWQCGGMILLTKLLNESQSSFSIYLLAVSWYASCVDSSVRLALKVYW